MQSSQDKVLAVLRITAEESARTDADAEVFDLRQQCEELKAALNQASDAPLPSPEVLNPNPKS